ncbi:hypothetical protein Tco_0302990 [Tanacetum coccineum]
MIIFFSRLVLLLDEFRKSQLRLTSWLGNCAGESCSHLFFSCSMARNITTKMARWWEFDCPDLFSYDDWLVWFHTLRLLKDVFQQSQPQPRFKEPQPQPPKDKRKKRVAKRATVNLVDENDEEEEPIRQCARWSREEEILLTQCWIETSENGQIRADRSEDSFWGQIMDDFNTAQQPKGRKFQLEHCWRILKGHSKWDASKPLDTEDHTEIFRPDVRPRPAGNTRPAKKTKFETTGSSRGSASGYLSDYVSEDLRRKLQAGTSAYEAKKEKEVAMMKFKEMEFLAIDADLLPEPKASIIQNRQEKIIAKYAQQ